MLIIWTSFRGTPRVKAVFIRTISGTSGALMRRGAGFD